MSLSSAAQDPETCANSVSQPWTMRMDQVTDITADPTTSTKCNWLLSKLTLSRFSAPLHFLLPSWKNLNTSHLLPDLRAYFPRPSMLSPVVCFCIESAWAPCSLGISEVPLLCPLTLRADHAGQTVGACRAGTNGSVCPTHMCPVSTALGDRVLIG